MSDYKKIPKYPTGYDKDSVPNAIKRGQARKEALEKKKDGPARVKLGRKSLDNFGYKIEDHKGRIIKKGGKDF